MNKGLWYFFLVLFFAVGVSVLYNEGQKTITGNAVAETSGLSVPKAMDSDGGKAPDQAGYVLSSGGIIEINGKKVGGVTSVSADYCNDKGKLVEIYIVRDSGKNPGYLVKSMEYDASNSGSGSCVTEEIQVVLSRADSTRMTKENLEKLTLVKKKSSKEYLYTMKAASWVNNDDGSTELKDAVAKLQARLEVVEGKLGINPSVQCNNGIDDDGDGKIDFASPNVAGSSSDPECAGITDNGEDLEGTQ